MRCRGERQKHCPGVSLGFARILWRKRGTYKFSAKCCSDAIERREGPEGRTAQLRLLRVFRTYVRPADSLNAHNRTKGWWF